MRRPADQRSLRGVAAALTWQPTDGIGSAADPGGTVTVTVSNDAGTALVTAAATGGTGAAVRTYTLAATHTASLDRLAVSWLVDGSEVATSSCEIVSRYYADLPDIMARATKIGGGSWSAEQVDQVRAEVEHEFEDALGFSCVPRYARERVTVRRTSAELVMPHKPLRSITSVTVYDGTTGTALTATELASIVPNEVGTLRRTDGGCWYDGTDVEAVYEHGETSPHQDIKRAFLERLFDRLAAKNSAVSARASTMSTSDGITTAFASPGSEKWITGIYEVDTVLMRYRRPEIGLA